MSFFSIFRKKKDPAKAAGTREKVLDEVERLHQSGAKSQAMAVLEVAYRNKEISAFDYESERTVLLREFD